MVLVTYIVAIGAVTLLLQGAAEQASLPGQTTSGPMRSTCLGELGYC